MFKILSNYFIRYFLLSSRCAQKEVGQICENNEYTLKKNKNNKKKLTPNILLLESLLHSEIAKEYFKVISLTIYMSKYFVLFQIFKVKIIEI